MRQLTSSRTRLTPREPVKTPWCIRNSARTRRTRGNLFISLSSVPGKRSEHDCGLLQFVLGDSIGEVGIRVARADVIVVEILDHVETWQSHFIEGDMIRASDGFINVARNAEIFQGFQPCIEDCLRSL